MSVIDKDGKIPGTPNFLVKGDIEIVDQGIHLGAAFLAAHLSDYHPLVNPEKSRKGLSFGLKLRFSDEVTKYGATPHYIFDTGAKSNGTRGVSLYILEDKFVMTLATSKAVWTVRVARQNSVLSVYLRMKNMIPIRGGG